ncbi:hypothetical protein SUNI508_05474 [Seiridium unicorne]|uniref:Uncharacterized protein n=1 Tax=Seiridium unicorne TaxID=138068 RepID=A0ABR2V5H4_9PEZI
MAPYDYPETSGSDSLAYGKSGNPGDVSDHTINNASADINTLARIHGISSNVGPTKLNLPTSSSSVGNQTVSNKTTTHEAAVCDVLPHVRTPSFGHDHPYPPYQIARDLPFHSLFDLSKDSFELDDIDSVIATNHCSREHFSRTVYAASYRAALRCRFAAFNRPRSLSFSFPILRTDLEVEEQFHEHLRPEDIDELERFAPTYRESMTWSQAVLRLGRIVTIVCLAKVDHYEPDDTGAAEYRRQCAVVQARLQAESIPYFGRRLLYRDMDIYKSQPLRGYGTWEEWVAAGRPVE